MIHRAHVYVPPEESSARFRLKFTQLNYLLFHKDMTILTPWHCDQTQRSYVSKVVTGKNLRTLTLLLFVLDTICTYSDFTSKKWVHVFRLLLCPNDIQWWQRQRDQASLHDDAPDQPSAKVAPVGCQLTTFGTSNYSCHYPRVGCTAEVVTHAVWDVSAPGLSSRDWRTFCHLGGTLAGTLSCIPALRTSCVTKTLN